MLFEYESEFETKDIEYYQSEIGQHMCTSYEDAKAAFFGSKGIKTATQLKTKTEMKAKKSVYIFPEFKDVPNLVFAIKNDSKFISVLTSCKKTKYIMAYIYIEDRQNIVLVIKKPDTYPCIILKIPIDNAFVYTNSCDYDICYQFPIDSLVSKELKPVSTQYMFWLQRSKDTTFNMTTCINNNLKTTVVDNIKPVDKSVFHMLINTNNFIQSKLNSFVLTPTADSMSEFNNMHILVVKKLDANSSPIIFNQSAPNVAKNKCYFEFKGTTLNFIIANNSKTDIQEIARKDNTVYFPSIPFNDKRYVMQQYENLFKLSNTNKSSRDNIYYVFSSYLNAYMFSKVSTEQDISMDENQNYLYYNIFNKQHQTIESYMLIEEIVKQ